MKTSVTSLYLKGDASPLHPYLQSWRSLSEHAADANPFYQPEAFAAAIKHLTPNIEVHVVLVWGYSTTGEELIGFFPLAPRSGGVPTSQRHLELYTHRHCYVGVPLVHARYNDHAVEAFAEYCVNSPLIHSVRGVMIPRQSSFLSSLTRCVDSERLPMLVEPLGARPVLTTGLSFHEHAHSVMSAKRRSKTRRICRRLRELGKVRFTRFDAERDDPEAWSRDFLQLEHCGWKGAGGKSLVSNPSQASFFREMHQGVYTQGLTDIYRMTVDDEPVAMNYQLRSYGDSTFGFKMAHNPKFARFSPGYLLTLGMTEDVLDRRNDVRWFDSCVYEPNTMFHSLWSERVDMVRIRFGDRAVVTRLGFTASTLLRRLERGRGRSNSKR